MSDYTLRLSEAELGRYRAMAALARADEGALWEQAGIRPGARVADVGCGPGALLPALAEVVGPGGSVAAIDGNDEAVATATALVASSGLGNVTVGKARADATGLAPGSFDVVTMRHVLAHNGGHEQGIVDHLASLTRPGGAVYLVDAYFPGFHVRGLDAGLDGLDESYARLHAGRGNDVNIGVRLDELLAAAGLEVEAYRGWYSIMRPPPGIRPPAWAARDEMLADGVIDEADVARWEQAWERVDAQPPGSVTVFAAIFAAIGRRLND